MAAFRGALTAARLEAGLAALFAGFLERLVATRAGPLFFAPFALLRAVLFAGRGTAFLAALFTTLFDARFAPFAFFALFFDAFDLAIGEPLRPSTAAEDPPTATGGRACLDRLS